MNSVLRKIDVASTEMKVFTNRGDESVMARRRVTGALMEPPPHREHLDGT